MGAPKKRQVFDAATGTGQSGGVRTNGHFYLAVLVVTRNVDTSNDTLDVRLEVSANGTDWATGRNANGDPSQVTASDLGPNGNGVAVSHGVPAEEMRANINAYTDSAGGDLEVDAWVIAGGWTGPGMRNRSV
jgi:hypothetical protein